MDNSEFLALVDRARMAKPFWFEGEMDIPATDSQITQAEHEIGAQFPDEYRFFLSKFGGGYFGHANVFSVTPRSDWNINSINSRYNVRNDFVAVSDDQAGGYYGFMRHSGHLSPQIFYIYPPEGDALKEKYPPLFVFLHSVALEEI